MRDIRVASVQFEHAAGDKQANLSIVRDFVTRAAQRHVELIVFPECCITGYWFLRKLSREQLQALVELVPDGPSSLTLMALAKEHNMTIGAGLAETADDGKMYNTYVVAMPNGEFQRHRKIHCFISEHLSCGGEYTVFGTPHDCRVAVLTCYDNDLGENVRMVALKGAEILLAPHQTGGCKTPSPHCMGLIERSLWDNRKANPQAIEAEFKGPKGRQWLLTWLPARAHDNGLFLIFSNGVGIDGDENEMIVADLKAALRYNCTGIRWIKTRRPELYGQLAVPTGLEKDIRSVRFGKEL